VVATAIAIAIAIDEMMLWIDALEVVVLCYLNFDGSLVISCFSAEASKSKLILRRLKCAANGEIVMIDSEVFSATVVFFAAGQSIHTTAIGLLPFHPNSKKNINGFGLSVSHRAHIICNHSGIPKAIPEPLAAAVSEFDRGFVSK
jgi:hypothetical protein